MANCLSHSFIRFTRGYDNKSSVSNWRSVTQYGFGCSIHSPLIWCRISSSLSVSTGSNVNVPSLLISREHFNDRRLRFRLHFRLCRFGLCLLGTCEESLSNKIVSLETPGASTFDGEDGEVRGKITSSTKSLRSKFARRHASSHRPIAIS